MLTELEIAHACASAEAEAEETECRIADQLASISDEFITTDAQQYVEQFDLWGQKPILETIAASKEYPNKIRGIASSIAFNAQLEITTCGGCESERHDLCTKCNCCENCCYCNEGEL